MIENNSMIARFEDPEIIKVILDKDSPNTFKIIKLDNDGEEYSTDIAIGMPMLEVKLVNNSTHDFDFPLSSLLLYGLLGERYNLKSGETKNGKTLLGTPDGNNYLIPVNTPIGVTFAVTDTVNCTLYSTFIIATDLSLDAPRSCTITFTDS